MHLSMVLSIETHRLDPTMLPLSLRLPKWYPNLVQRTTKFCRHKLRMRHANNHCTSWRPFSVFSSAILFKPKSEWRNSDIRAAVQLAQKLKICFVIYSAFDITAWRYGTLEEVPKFSTKEQKMRDIQSQRPGHSLCDHPPVHTKLACALVDYRLHASSAHSLPFIKTVHFPQCFPHQHFPSTKIHS